MSKLINKLINQGQEYLLAGGGSKEKADDIVYLTEEEYEALTPEQKSDEDTTYMITGEGSVGPMGDIDDSQVKHLNEEGEEDGTVQEKLNSLKEESTNLTNKVNFLELNGGFFPLLADNVIYTGSSFSYTAEEDTMLFISDNSDTYLKIDGANIAGNYTPGYIFVGEGQTITYSRSCKVYKANNTIVIDDSNVTLGLMDNTYLGAVNFDDNKVASVNSAHLGNNKVATASGTGDLNFHFEHTFNTQHSKMDSAELVPSGLTYEEYSKTYILTGIDDEWQIKNPIETEINDIPFEIQGEKYSIQGFRISSTTGSYVILSKLDDDYSIIDTKEIELPNSVQAEGYLKKSGRLFSFNASVGHFSYLYYIDDNFEIKEIQKSSSANFDYLTPICNNMVGIMVSSTGSGRCCVFGENLSVGRYDYPIINPHIICYTNGDIYIYAYYFGGDKRLLSQKYSNGVKTTISNESDLPFFDIIDSLKDFGYYLLDNDNNIIYSNKGVVDSKNIIKEGGLSPSIINFSEEGVEYITYNTINNNDNRFFDLKVNNVTAPTKQLIIGTGALSSIQFGKATFDTTDTVSIDVSIKNNSGTSKSVTLPKSGWSTSGNKTVGSGTSFTFNNN